MLLNNLFFFIYSSFTETSDESDNENEDSNDLESETGGSDLEESWQGVCLLKNLLSLAYPGHNGRGPMILYAPNAKFSLLFKTC